MTNFKKSGKKSGMVIGALALTAVAATASAQTWGRPSTPSSGACFYEDINFGGRYFCSRAGSTTAAVPPGTNDRISSIRVFGKAEIFVFQDAEYRGRSQRFDSSIRDLREVGWNDRISSFRIGSRDGGNWGSGNGNWGGSRWTHPQAEEMVRHGYRSMLDRDPDPSGLRSWAERVLSNNWTQQQLNNELRQTDEYRELHQRSRR